MDLSTIETSDLIYEEGTSIGGYDVGFDRKLLVPRMVEILHEASTRQVMSLGLSALELDPYDLTWVMVRQHVEIDCRPSMGDHVKVRTYPSGKDRLYTYRDFCLMSESGDGLVKCSSTWILMNTATRSIGTYPPNLSELLMQSNGFEHFDRCEKLRIRSNALQTSHTVQARWHDLDFNGHVSTPHYYRWMLDAIPSAWQRTKVLKSISINIREEIRLGQSIAIFIQEFADGILHHALESDGTNIAIGQSTWDDHGT